MISDIIDVLADPIDGSALELTGGGFESSSGRSVRSVTGHNYDIAKQGYVTLAGGAGLRFTGDDAAMIAARDEFLATGHYAPFVEATTAAVGEAIDDLSDEVLPEQCPPTICEIGAGTGFYLAHTLDAIEGARGVGIDVSVPAAKKLAKSHPRVGAVVADAWARLPLRDESVDAITVVFAPRNAAEFARVLKPGGQVVVMTADQGHLAPLREQLGIIDVEAGKVERMIAQAAGHLELVETASISFDMTLTHAEILALVHMGPSARHIEPAVLADRVAALPDKVTVGARGTVTRLRRAEKKDD